VIDTALLYTYKGLSQATPSLVHLAQQLLGQTLRARGGGGSGGGGDGGAQGLEPPRSDEKEQARKREGKEKGGGSSGGGAAANGRSAGPGTAINGDGGGGGVHDSREDAAAAMGLVAYEMAREAEGKPTGSLDPPALKVGGRGAGRGVQGVPGGRP
jgi:hypothetical protein